MFLKKFCYLICAIFLLNNLNDIYKNSKSVQYTVKSDDDANLNKEIDFTFCIKLDEKLLENFKISKDEYRFTVEKLVEFTCHNHYSNDTCNQLINLNKSYLFNYHACLVFNDTNFDILIRNLTSLDFTIFLILNQRYQLYFYENVFSSENAGFKLNNELIPFTLNINLVDVFFLESPFETDCFNYSNDNANIETKELIYSRASCLYECYKSESKSRSLSYYYSRKDDMELIVTKDDLDYLKGVGKWKIFDKNLTVDLDKKCLKLCRKRSCKFTNYLTNQFKGTKQTQFNLTYKLNIQEAIPNKTKFQTTINFFSLIILFLNISFYETISCLLKKLLSIQLIKNFVSIHFRRFYLLSENYFWIFKLIILINCILIVLILSTFIIIKYLNTDYHQLEAFNFPTEIIPFYLMICVPVQILLYGHNKLDSNLESNLLNTKSFTQLENLTNFTKFEKNLERLYIQYATIEKSIDFKIDKTKIVFKYFNYEFENYTINDFLLRCFKIDFNFKELRYEMLYSISELKMNLKFNWYIVYPLSKGHHLSTIDKNMNLDPYTYLKKYKTKINCTDYSKDNYLKNFGSNENRINQCINDEHLKNYNNLTIYSVIYKNMLSLNYNLDNVYFNYSLDKKIVNECRKNYSTYNCYSEFFRINWAKPINLINETFCLYLYYPDYIVIDNLILALSDLILNNLISLECIFIGLNIGKLLFILFALLKRYKFKRTLKYYGFFKFFILLIGLSIHFYFIIDDILNDEYIFIKEFSVFKSFQPPSLIFCFIIKNKIDYNYNQTTNYLDNLSKDLNLNLFYNISLLDGNYDENIFEPNKKETFNYFKKINTIYFLNLKCFEFIFKKYENTRYYHLLKNQNFVSIKLNRSKILEYFNSSSLDLYFMNKKELSNEINGIDKIKIEYNNNNPHILIHQSLVAIEIKEKFTICKQPLSIFYGTVNLNDTTKYINDLKNDFKKFNLKTKRLPIKSKAHNLEIDDELFDQYYYQIKNRTDYNSYRDLSFRREIYSTSIIESELESDNYFNIEFYLNPFTITYTFTNRDDHSKFIISILNCLNIWINFCVLDLYIYLNLVYNLIFKFYYFFLRIQFYLNTKIFNLLTE